MWTHTCACAGKARSPVMTRHQLHLVVRGLEGAAGDLPLLDDAIGTAGEKDCRVPTGTAGLVGAGAVGPDVVSEVAERNHDARSLPNDVDSAARGGH